MSYLEIIQFWPSRWFLFQHFWTYTLPATSVAFNVERFLLFLPFAFPLIVLALFYVPVPLEPAPEAKASSSAAPTHLLCGLGHLNISIDFILAQVSHVVSAAT